MLWTHGATGLPCGVGFGAWFTFMTGASCVVVHIEPHWTRFAVGVGREIREPPGFTLDTVSLGKRPSGAVATDSSSWGRARAGWAVGAATRPGPGEFALDTVFAEPLVRCVGESPGMAGVAITLVDLEMPG